MTRYLSNMERAEILLQALPYIQSMSEKLYH